MCVYLDTYVNIGDSFNLLSEYLTYSIRGNYQEGLKVLLHTHDSYPAVDSNGIALSPGIEAIIGIDKVEVSTNTNTKYKKMCLKLQIYKQ